MPSKIEQMSHFGEVNTPQGKAKEIVRQLALLTAPFLSLGTAEAQEVANQPTPIVETNQVIGGAEYRKIAADDVRANILELPITASRTLTQEDARLSAGYRHMVYGNGDLHNTEFLGTVQYPFDASGAEVGVSVTRGDVFNNRFGIMEGVSYNTPDRNPIPS